MANYKYVLNKRTGQHQLVNDDGILFFKASVANVAALPGTGNTKNDARIVNDSHNLYVWSGIAWVNQGDVMNIGWSTIENRPSSIVADIDAAVTKKHEKNEDQYLDYGGANQIAVTEVTKKLTANVDYYINCDTGNDSNPGTSALPFLTVAKAISLLPLNLNYKTVNIYLQPSLNYTESIQLLGFYNMYALIVKRTSGEVLITNSAPIFIRNCSGKIQIGAMNLKTIGNNKICISVGNSSFVEIAGTVKLSDDGSTGTTGIKADRSLVGITNAIGDYDANKVETGLQALNGGIIYTPASPTFGDTYLSTANTGEIIVGSGKHLIDADLDDAVAKKHSNSLDHSQDADTKLKSGVVTVDSNNNVGIGTANPLEKFHVEGNAKITGELKGKPDDYTKLLLRCNGIDGSTVFIDETGKTITAYGNAQIDTAQKKFGSASGKFDGDDWLLVEDISDLKWGTGDGTLDFWIRFNGAPGGIMFARGTGHFYFGYFGSLLMQLPSGNYFATVPTVFVDATWYHLALVRSSGNIMFFVDGIKVGDSVVCTADIDFSDLTIGAAVGGDYGVNGWMDEFRWSKGIARWTANFILPTSEYKGIVVTHDSVGIGVDSPTEKLDVDGNIKATGNIEIEGELKIKVYAQDNEPTLGADQRLAIWQDTNDSNRIYLIFKRGFTASGIDEQVKIEISQVDKYIVINEQTDSYVLVLTDDSKLIDMNKGSACTLTVPKNSVVAFPIGTTIAIRQKGAGQVTIAPVDGDVTINSADGLKTTNQFAMATLIKIDINTWSAFGSLLT